MREKTSLLEFGVDSADCSVQSAGSLLGGGLPKLAMSGGSRTRARCKRGQRQRANRCSAQRCLQDDRKGTGRQMIAVLDNAPSPFEFVMRRCYAQHKIGKYEALSQGIILQRQHFLLPIFVLRGWSPPTGQFQAHLVACWLPLLRLQIDGRGNRAAQTRADISLSARQATIHKLTITCLSFSNSLCFFLLFPFCLSFPLSLLYSQALAARLFFPTSKRLHPDLRRIRCHSRRRAQYEQV